MRPWLPVSVLRVVVPMRGRVVFVAIGMGVLVALAVALAPTDLGGALGYVARRPGEVLIALAAYTAAFVLRASSWRPFVGGAISRARLFSLLMGALFLNHAAPAKAGDLARVYAVSRRGVPGEEAVVGVLVSRAVDLTGLLAVLGVAWSLAGAGGRGEAVLPVAAVLSAIVALALLPRLRLPGVFSAGGSGRLAGLLRRVEGVRVALGEVSPGVLLRSFVFAAPAWVLEAGILWAVGRGLGMGLTPAEVVAATCFAVLVAAVPLTPGSLGTYEAGMVGILISFGISAETAFAAAVATHAVKFLYAFAAAPFAFWEGLAAVRKGGADEAGLQV